MAHRQIPMPLLRGPLLIRGHLLKPSAQRYFHASPTPQFLESTLTATHALFTTLHTSTGLSWSTLIPLTAVLLRLSITTPLTIYSRRRALKTLSLQPLVAAWQHPLARAAKISTSSPQAWERATRKAVRAKRKEIWKRHGCQAWKVYVAPAMQIPVWIAASVTLRGMAGRDGLPEWIQRVTGGASSTAGEEAGAGVVAAVAAERIVPLEASFADEGALWFLDLLQEDPVMLLPMGFSFLMFANIEFQSLQHPPSTRNQRIFTNAIRLLPLVVFPLIIYQPSAITLYWATSAAFSFVQNGILAKVMPRPKELEPCKSVDPYRVPPKVDTAAKQ